MAGQKILAISSPGGHWVQLNRICGRLSSEHSIVYASPRSQYQLDSSEGETVHNIVDASADTKWMLVPLMAQIAVLIIRERPRIIISTGAAPGVVAMLLGRVLRIRTIWVDSIANVQSLSSSGAMALRFSDVILTQWESLSDGEQVLYRGAVL